jgi:hypothetical protein
LNLTSTAYQPGYSRAHAPIVLERMKSDAVRSVWR